MNKVLSTAIDNGASLLVSSISGKIGDNILEAFGDKIKLNQLEKFTKSTVKDCFQRENDDIINLILNYIYINTTINLKYSFQHELSSDVEDELWDDFIEYYKKECAEVPSGQFKSKIVYCVNQHNIKFKKLFLDDKTSFLAQLIKENETTNKNVMISVAELNHLVTEIDTKISKENEHIQKMRESLEYGIKGTKIWLAIVSILLLFSGEILTRILGNIYSLGQTIVSIIFCVLVIFFLCCLGFIIYSFIKIFKREKILSQYNLSVAITEFEQYIAVASKKILRNDKTDKYE